MNRMLGEDDAGRKPCAVLREPVGAANGEFGYRRLKFLSKGLKPIYSGHTPVASPAVRARPVGINGSGRSSNRQFDCALAAVYLSLKIREATRGRSIFARCRYDGQNRPRGPVGPAMKSMSAREAENGDG